MGILARFRRPRAVSLYAQIGGHDALDVVVEDFYCRVLDDDRLAVFYASADMRCVKARQVEFLSAMLGGPGPYTGSSMRHVHEGRGITRYHFDLLAAHFGDSLAAAGLHPDTITAILDAITPLAGEITAKDIKAVV